MHRLYEFVQQAFVLSGVTFAVACTSVTQNGVDAGTDPASAQDLSGAAAIPSAYQRHIIFVTSKAFPGYEFANRKDICGSIAQQSILPEVRNVKKWISWLSYYDANNSPMQNSGSAINWLTEQIRVANPELSTDPIQIGSWYSTDLTQTQPIFNNLYTFRSGPRDGVIRDENGALVPGESAAVWTGTRLDGTASPFLELCPDLYPFSTSRLASWSGRYESPKGRIGIAGRTSSDWTDYGLQFCTEPARLYCISVKL